MVIAVGLGAFAPKVEHALSGAGWEATGSESAEGARDRRPRVRRTVVLGAAWSSCTRPSKTAGEPEFDQVVADAQRTLAADERVTDVVPPRPGQSISRDGHTAIVQAGAAASSNEMVRAADDLKDRAEGLGRASASP